MGSQVEGDVIGDALNTYCLRWLPDCCDKYRLLIESVICLLKTDKGLHLELLYSWWYDFNNSIGIVMLGVLILALLWSCYRLERLVY